MMSVMKTKQTNSSYTFTGFDDWIEVFQAGTQTDASGQTKTFSQSDLDSMVANHQPAPIVIGHPKVNDPAFGWSHELKREGDSLFAKFKDVEPQFETLVEQHRYPERSIRLGRVDNGYQLLHVGFLGAARPAVSGMKPIEFSDDASQTLEFSGDWYVTSRLSRLFRRMKNFLIEDKGEAKAEEIFPEYELDSLSEASVEQRLAETDESVPGSFTQDPKGEMTVGEFTQKQLDDAVAKAVSDATTQAKADAENDYTAKLAEVKSKQRKAEALQRVDTLLSEQKLLPAQTAGLAEFMAALDDGSDATFEFSVGDGDQAKTEKQSPSQFFNAFLDNLVEHGLLNKQEQDVSTETNYVAPEGSNVDGERLELHQKAMQYMDAHEGVEFIAAVKAVGG